MSENDLPNSPVTGNRNVGRFDSVRVSDIVQLYREQEGVSVERFFGHCDEVHLLECRETGYRFYYPFEVAGDEKFYQELGAKATAIGQDYDRDWSEDHSIAQRYIFPSDSLLEIGCNTGKFLTGISETTTDVRGLEFDEIAADTARNKDLAVFNESIEVYSEKNAGAFDVVCAFQVLEHVTTVRSFLTSALRTLRPGGRLIFSVPNNDPYFQRFNKYEVMNLPPHHVGLWNLQAFEKLSNFFEMDLIDHGYSAVTSFRGDVYLRARLMAAIKSLPRKHSALETARMLVVAPAALAGSTLDYVAGKANFGHITVVFRKRDQSG